MALRMKKRKQAAAGSTLLVRSRRSFAKPGFDKGDVFEPELFSFDFIFPRMRVRISSVTCTRSMIS